MSGSVWASNAVRSLPASTVSRTLNNRSGVNIETRKKVLAAAIDRGYRANPFGRSLRRDATNTIGFVVETGSAANRKSGEYFFIVFDEMNPYLTDRSYHPEIPPCHSAEDPVAFLARAVALGTVGELVTTVTRRHDRRIEMLARSDLPFITPGRSESEGGYPWIDLDFEGVAARSVQELVAHGHRRIAVGLQDREVMLGHCYRRGFAQPIAAARSPVEEDLIFRIPPSEAGGFELGRLVANANPRPTAVMLCFEAATVGPCASLQHTGTMPGADISVITLRENPHLRFLAPPPACFRGVVALIGQMLAESVLRLLSTDEDPQPGRKTGIVLPMAYVAAASLS